MFKVVIILGSLIDKDFIKPACKILDDFAIKYETRVASAHKTPNKLLEILQEYENEKLVYITVAGKSNALSGVIDANTASPVIACPPYSERFGGSDVYSSLRLPRGVAPMIVLEPENAALAAIKILALSNTLLQEKISKFQNNMKQEINNADNDMKKV